ncbi:MAG TPA: ATP-binding protein [Candidatus Omnitrophota bacterium]|nr:ATP-binding protein [Candidatus Omnitrophota bacterium]HPS37644.1 ATP-binding protein [Candidatus Omnitrophota bacterium]
MPLPKFGFAKRFLALYAVVFVSVLLVTDWNLSRTLEERNFDQLQNSLVRQSLLVRELNAPRLKEPAELQEQIQKIARVNESRITVIDLHGKVLADSEESPSLIPQMDNHATRPEIAAALRGETGTSVRYSTTLQKKMLYVALPILDQNTITGVVRTAMPIELVDRVLTTARKSILLSTLLGILIILIAGILFSNRLTNRIRRITSVAERFAKEDWSERILINGKDELKLLADTMNRMAATLRARIGDLEAEKNKVSAILSNMTEAVIAIDHRRQFAAANPNAEKLFGFESKRAQGKSLIELTRHPRLEEISERAIQEKRTLTEEIQFPVTKKILLLSVVPLGEQTRDIGIILVFHDITELRRLENVRKEFVANASHELRTPLTSLQGFIETLLGGAITDPAASERFLRIMQEDAARLGRLVEDMLTLSEIEQGIVPLKKELLDLSVEAGEVLERFKLRAHEGKVSIENCLPRAGTLQMNGDKDKIRQVFTNLIDNAIKFNRENGKVILTAAREAQGIVITIEDTGTGIPPHALPRIFERFFRVDKARSRELGGTGLGLAIVKHIMENHGGRISCKSEPGKGSSFSVLFPA